MKTGLSQWLQTALDFVFPAECQYCHGFLGNERIVIFCRTCWETISLIREPRCPRCGQPHTSKKIHESPLPLPCRVCRATTPFFDRALAAAYYEDMLKEAIHQFKFRQKTALGNPLAQILATTLSKEFHLFNNHTVLPVPLHRTRQRQRGYNQSAILAKEVARHFHLPLVLNNLRRIRPTESQARLNGRKARQENVKDAFQVTSPAELCEKQVILVDDVMTTGATVNECAKTLKKAGVKSVLVLTVSRPDPHTFS